MKIRERLLIGVLVVASLPMACVAEQFVHVSVELDTVDWGFNSDSLTTLRATTWTAQCVIGTNSWQITETSPSTRGTRTYWFTGSNILNSFVTTKPVSDYPDLYERNHGPMPSVGQRTTGTIESADGNPTHPGPEANLIDYPGKICWLAFCSGPVLKHEGRKIFPPSSMWMEYTRRPPGFSEKTEVFEDDFGLPRSLALYTENQQPVFQYQAILSTNVLGWDIPLEFHMAQYSQHGTNAWALVLTAKGKVTSVTTGGPPRFP